MKFFGSGTRRLAVLASVACLISSVGIAMAPSLSSAASAPTHGGTRQTAFQSSPTTFDPQVCYDATCWDNMELIFNRLYDYQPSTTTLVPQAAASLPKISANGRVYTIAIRPGMEFSNGTPVTAQDFAYTFSRICDPATKSPVVGFWTVVAGCTAYAKSPTGYVSGIVPVSAGSLQITLTQPDAAFVYVLAMPHASVIPTGTGAQQAASPLGSGPYELGSYTPGQSIVLKRNPHYWNTSLPYTDGINEKLGVSPQVQLLELEKGQLDIMGDTLPNSSYLSVIKNAALKKQTVTSWKLDTYYLTLNMKMKPFNNPLVREAVSYAVNRQSLLKYVNGQGKAATGFIPPGVKGYTSTSLVNPLNIAKAKSLLKRAGYPHGFSTSMYSWNTQPWTNLDAALQQQLAAVGIKLAVHAIQESTFFGLAATPNKAPMTLTFWVADFPDASDFFNALVSCASDVPGGQNYSFYCNHSMDALVNKGLATPSKASVDYVAAAKKLLADNPIVPLYFGKVTTVFGSNVGGFVQNPIWAYVMDHYWLKSTSK
jgi:peptide/nickel transport system substrate-binding protein/oligopeptide transport system substrate-binding protein